MTISSEQLVLTDSETLDEVLKISRKRRGCRLIYRKLFGFKQMLAFLCQVVERKYQVVENIYLPAD